MAQLASAAGGPEAMARIMEGEVPEAFAQMMAGAAGAASQQVPRMDREEDPADEAPLPAPGTAVFFGEYDDRATVHEHGADGCTIIPEDGVHANGQVEFQRVQAADLTVDEATDALVPGVVVRIKASVTRPRFNWGDVTRQSIGIITARALSRIL